MPGLQHKSFLTEKDNQGQTDVKISHRFLVVLDKSQTDEFIDKVFIILVEYKECCSSTSTNNRVRPCRS